MKKHQAKPVVLDQRGLVLGVVKKFPLIAQKTMKTLSNNDIIISSVTKSLQVWKYLGAMNA